MSMGWEGSLFRAHYPSGPSHLPTPHGACLLAYLARKNHSNSELPPSPQRLEPVRPQQEA